MDWAYRTKLEQASPASVRTIRSFLHFHWPASPRLHTLHYSPQTLAYGLYTHTQKIFSASTVLFLSLYPPLTPFFQPLSLSLTPIWGIMVKKKSSLLHFPHLLPSHAFLAPSQRCACTLFDVEVGGEKEWRGGKARGHKVTIEKTRTGAKRDAEVGSSGVAHGERRYLINTNARSKLFRQASNTSLSLACGTQQTDEPIRSDEMRSNHLWGYFTQTHIHSLSHTHIQI